MDWTRYTFCDVYIQHLLEVLNIIPIVSTWSLTSLPTPPSEKKKALGEIGKGGM